jgi:hypothetical protein
LIVTAEEWTVERPFFAVPAGEGGLTSFLRAAERAGVDLYRVIDPLTKAKPVFVKSGIPGSVGSAACSLWRDLGRRLIMHRDFKVWPFDGDLASLLQHSQIVLGEIYPRAAYATALLEDPPAFRAPLAVAKTIAAVRGAALQALLTSNWIKTQNVVIQDLDAAAGNEDDFDACVTSVALLRCVLEDTPLAIPNLTDGVAEGGILGSATINLGLSERTFHPELGSTADVGALGLPIRHRAERLSTHFPCPIPGCDKVFQGSRGGWDAHVGSVRIHPEWCPDLLSSDERKRQFEREFPGFFEQ